MKLNKRIEIAKVGNWNGFDITESMLKEMHSNFQKVPIRAGHTTITKGQKTDGLILSAYYENGILSGDIELSEQLAEDYKNNKYISWSMDANKYNNGWNITALALLGAEKPGIKGLKELQFSEDNQKLNITFQEVQDMDTAEIKKELAETVKLAMSEMMSKDDENAELKKEIEMLKAKIAELESKNLEMSETVLQFAEKEKTEKEKALADHNAKVEARKTEIMQFNEPEALEFEKLFKDKPENAIFMEKYAVTDTRAKSAQDTALSFSEKDLPVKSLTERQLEAGKNKTKIKE
jgi:hypothetical protein